VAGLVLGMIGLVGGLVPVAGWFMLPVNVAAVLKCAC